MPFLRRRPLPPPFLETAGLVDRAQRALLAAVPTARDEGVPLAMALAAFGRHLGEAETSLERWREGPLDGHRDTCAQAIAAAREAAADLRISAEPLGFERLNERIGQVLAPLEALADIEALLKR